MEPRGTLWELANERCGGNLADLLAQFRSEGRSFSAIAVDLRINHNVKVTYETVRQWVKALGIGAGTAA